MQTQTVHRETTPYETFMDEVQHRMGLSSAVQTLNAARAVLETLVECLPGVVACDVSTRLTGSLQVEHKGAEWMPGEALTVKEFILRVAERAGTDETSAFYHARAVFQLLSALIGEELVDRIRDELPIQFDLLWGMDPASVHMHQPIA